MGMRTAARNRPVEGGGGDLSAVVEVMNELSGCDSVEEICRRAVELGRERLGFHRLGICFFDPEAPVLLMSGYSQTETAAGGAGGEEPDGFLQKPFSLESLREAVESVARQSRPSA